MPNFEITDVNVVYATPAFAYATVHCDYEETLSGGHEVEQNVSVKVRVGLPDDATVEDLHQAFLDEAVRVLGLAAVDLEGKSARELSAASHAIFDPEAP